MHSGSCRFPVPVPGRSGQHPGSCCCSSCRSAATGRNCHRLHSCRQYPRGCRHRPRCRSCWPLPVLQPGLRANHVRGNLRCCPLQPWPHPAYCSGRCSCRSTARLAPSIPLHVPCRLHFHAPGVPLLPAHPVQPVSGQRVRLAVARNRQRCQATTTGLQVISKSYSSCLYLRPELLFSPQPRDQVPTTASMHES